MSKQPRLTEEEIEQHLRPAGNVSVLDEDGSSLLAAGEAPRGRGEETRVGSLPPTPFQQGLRVDGNGRAPLPRNRDRIAADECPGKRNRVVPLAGADPEACEGR